MEATVKKEKVVNVGMTDGLMNFLDKWMEKMEASSKEEKMEASSKEENKEEKPGVEVKKLVCEMMKSELNKIDEELNDKKLDDSEWNQLMEKVDKISDIVKWW